MNFFPSVQFSSVQSLSRVWLFVTPWIAAHQASLSITNSRSSLRLKSIKSVMPSSHLILWRPLLLLPSIPPSIRVFSNESALRMRWTKYWSFSFSIIPSKEIPGLISFRMDWLDLLAAQGTLKSRLQHHSSKASILQRSAFFTMCQICLSKRWETVLIAFNFLLLFLVKCHKEESNKWDLKELHQLNTLSFLMKLKNMYRSSHLLCIINKEHQMNSWKSINFCTDN